MHNNYYFLKKLTSRLNGQIIGSKFGEIFSQNKDELIIGFYSAQSQLYIKAHLTSQFSCLSFSETFHRAKKNSVDLFPELIDQEIIEVKVNNYDRSFYIRTKDHYLLFKLHGNRSNILLLDNSSCQKIFKNQLQQDRSITLNDLNKTLQLDKNRFLELNGDLFKFIPVLGKEAQIHIENQKPKNTEEKWLYLQNILSEIEDEQIYVKTDNRLPELLLFNPGETYRVFKNPIEAINFFFQNHVTTLHIQQEKDRQLKSLNKLIKKGENYIQKNRKKLDELQSKKRYDQIADIIMANLHQIPSNTTKAMLYDFYNNENTEVSLKRHLNPQKNAELYYRKAKNQKIEIEQLKKNIRNKEIEIEGLKDQLTDTAQTKDIKTLKKKNKTGPNTTKPLESTIYRKYQYLGFDILLGRSAVKNDELTFKVANKDDLWLHAKDTSGSHVVIRHRAGHNIPDKVLEKAASLAAWHSKRRSEQYVPVAYTPRKHVRKTKDLVAGQVIVEKEKVILVPPEQFEGP